MKHLDIVDDRTLEQISADGDERWPDGKQYIKDGECCVCGKPAPEEFHTCLIHLDKPCACEMHLLLQEPQKCTMEAHWASGIEQLTALCDECIVNCLEQLPDTREWLAPALADIRERHLCIGARVRFQCLYPEDARGQLGTVYKQSHSSGWYVRPDTRPENQPGVLCMAYELDVIL